MKKRTQSPEWWAYILISDTNGETYVGVTVDIKRRLDQHNGNTPGGAKRTTRGRPWSIAKTHGPYANRSEAQRIEYAIKRLRGKDRVTWSELSRK